MGRLTARRPTPQRPSPAAPPRECLPTPGGVAARRGWPPLAAAAVSGRRQRRRAAGGGGDGVSRSRGRAPRQATPPPGPSLNAPQPPWCVRGDLHPSVWIGPLPPPHHSVNGRSPPLADAATSPHSFFYAHRLSTRAQQVPPHGPSPSPPPPRPHGRYGPPATGGGGFSGRGGRRRGESMRRRVRVGYPGVFSTATGGVRHAGRYADHCACHYAHGCACCQADGYARRRTDGHAPCRRTDGRACRCADGHVISHADGGGIGGTGGHPAQRGVPPRADAPPSPGHHRPPPRCPLGRLPRRRLPRRLPAVQPGPRVPLPPAVAGAAPVCGPHQRPVWAAGGGVRQLQRQHPFCLPARLCRRQWRRAV